MAALLLSFQGYVLAHEAGPRSASACACTHGGDQPCGCPMHAGAAHAEAPADDSKLPPCHRHRAHTAAPSAPSGPADGPCLRSDCSGTSSQLLLLSWLQLAPPQEHAAEPIVEPIPVSPLLEPQLGAREPSSPPPKRSA
jgi:hypothetical protein